MAKDQHSFYHNKTWQDYEDEYNYTENHLLTLHGKATLNELFQELHKYDYPGELGELVVSGSFRWEQTASEEDLGARKVRKIEGAKLTEKYERQTLARLKAKYEGD